MKNCTFYNNDVDLWHFGVGKMTTFLYNNIFEGTNTACISGYQPPNIVRGDYVGHQLVMRNNYFYDHATVLYASDGATSYSLAEVEALNQADASGNVAGTDPQMTDPASQDYSLQVGSPCRNTGYGSGALTGYNGVAFDGANPDVGAWASGAQAAPGAPTWAANTSNITATDGADSSEVDLACDVATPHASGSVGYIWEARTTAGPGAWVEKGRTTTPAFTVCNLTNGTSYDFRVKAYTRIATENTTTPVDTDTMTPTSGVAEPGAAPGISSVTASGLSVTVALTGSAGVSYRVRLESKTAEEDEQPKTGPGNVGLTGTTYGLHYVKAWCVGDAGNSEPTITYPVFLRASSSEWKMAAAAIASELDTALGSVTLVLPGQRFDSKSVSQWVLIERPAFGKGKGRSGERRVPVTVGLLCCAKTDGDTRDLGAADEIADTVESALTDADIKIETGKWLRFHKASVEGPFDEDLCQVARVEAEGIYEAGG
ncbi:MAG: hypothetical protein ACYS9X_22385 [Planctomycetota bacterium]